MRERNGGLDALRNLSMMMVVLLHVLLHGGALRGADFAELSASTAVLWVLEMGAVCAVNCFGMLSGYFGVRSRVKAASVLALWLQVVFYAVGIYVAWALLRMNPSKAAGWTQGLTPITGNMYWYYTAYAGLYLLMPALNQLLLSAKREKLRRWLLLLLAAVFVERLCFDSDVLMLSGGCSTLWLAVLYALGGYLRLYGETSRGYRWLQRHGLAVYGALSVAAGLYWWTRMSGRFPVLGGSLRWAQITAYNSIHAVSTAVCLFAVFSAWQPGGWVRRVSAFCAPAAFAVYLIHTHPVCWNELLLSRMTAYSRYPVPSMLLRIAAAVLIIFAVCVIVERIRMKVFALLRIDAACRALGERVERAIGRVLGE